MRVGDDQDPDVAGLVGIGPVSAEWLRRAGIPRRSDLEKVGVVGAFRKVAALGVKPSANLLWALQGALDGIHWAMVPPRTRDRLKDELSRIP